MAEELRIPLPISFENPFKYANRKVVTIWINSFRKRNGHPVLADWSAKALKEYATESQMDHFLAWHSHHKLGIIRPQDDPRWRVRVSSQAPKELTGAACLRSNLHPIRRLRGVFRGDNRKVPGWALDAVPANVSHTFEMHFGGHTPNGYVAFCLPDSSDMTLLRMFEYIQVSIGTGAHKAAVRGSNPISLKLYTDPSYVVHLNPDLIYKKDMILRQN